MATLIVEGRIATLTDEPASGESGIQLLMLKSESISYNLTGTASATYTVGKEVESIRPWQFSLLS